MPTASLALTVEQDALAQVGRILKDEADGKSLRRDLVRELKATTDHPIARAQAGIRSTPSKGITQGMPLRQTVAASIKPVVRLAGKQTGVSIRQARTTNLRGFKSAGRRFNRANFRHPVFGDMSTWVVQGGNHEWFDRPMQAARPEAKAAVVRAVDGLAQTLAARAAARQ